MHPFSLTIRQAVELSGLSRSAIYLAMKDGKLSARKAGRRTILITSDLMDYVKSLPAAK